MARRESFTYEFGSFRFDPRDGCLKDANRSISLPPRAAELLEVLLRNAGTIVSKEELLDGVWRVRGLNVEEGNLAYTIHHLRHAFGDSPEGRKCIETVPRRGYRFVAPVTVVPAIERGLPVAQPPTPTPARAAGGRRYLIAAATAALLIALALLFRGRLTPPAPRIVRITQLTDNLRPKDTMAGVDASRVFFYERPEKEFVLSAVPLSGGTVAPVGIPPEFEVVDVCPATSEMLAVRRTDSEADGELFRWSPRSRTLARVGTIMASTATWSADGKRIAYVTAHDILLANADGSAARRIAIAPAVPREMRWSPDGSLLRFNLEMGPDDVNRDAGWRSLIWEVRADGTGFRRMLPEPPDWTRQSVGQWTPDGRYFLFTLYRNARYELWATRERHGVLGISRGQPVALSLGLLSIGEFSIGRDGRLYVVGTDGRSELARYDSRLRTFVPFLGGISATWASFSPDRKWVAYESYPDFVVWRARADGSQAVQLTQQPLRVNGLSWSPDSKSIAFRGQWPGKAPKIFVVPAQGGAARPLLPAGLYPPDKDEGIPSWSADGNRVAFGEVPDRFGRGTGREVIHVYNIARQQLSALPGSEGLWTSRWSPSGRYIAALTIQGQKLMVYDFPAKTWKRFDVGDIENPTWSPDEEWIYFDTSSEERAICRVRLADGRVERITGITEYRPVRGWSGLDLEDSPLILHNIGGSEIYAIDIDLP